VLTSLSLLVLGTVASSRGQTPAPSAPADAPKALADIRKGVVENPTKRLVRESSAGPAALAAFTNPKVEPGRVRWHPTFEAACRASIRSGKPVLLFQMMGKLDDQFC
jgi:hypothetical protein